MYSPSSPVVATGFRENGSDQQEESLEYECDGNGYSKDNPIRTDHLVRFSRGKSSTHTWNINKFDKAIVTHRCFSYKRIVSFFDFKC